jgi:hypothetical protein
MKGEQSLQDGLLDGAQQGDFAEGSGTDDCSQTREEGGQGNKNRAKSYQISPSAGFLGALQGFVVFFCAVITGGIRENRRTSPAIPSMMRFSISPAKYCSLAAARRQCPSFRVYSPVSQAGFCRGCAGRECCGV